MKQLLLNYLLFVSLNNKISRRKKKYIEKILDKFDKQMEWDTHMGFQSDGDEIAESR